VRLRSWISNSIGDEGVTAISIALTAGGAPALVELWLGDNDVGDIGACSLANALKNGGAPALEELSLRNNRIGHNGVLAILDALKAGGAPALKMLYLYESEQDATIDGVSRQAVSDALKGRNVQVFWYSNYATFA
jgi:Ran GTPase-activating protein (RanGAP) involved in mRNA processing and transport